MTKLRFSLVALITVLCLITTKAQSPSDKLGSWYIYNGFFNFSPRFELFVESQSRNYEAFSNAESFFIRPYLNYNVTKNFQAGIGLEYHWNWEFADGDDKMARPDEFRTTLQTMLFQTEGRVKLQHRYRYEFRSIDSQLLQRMRYRIQATVPINNKSLTKGTFFVNAFNEVLVDSKPSWDFSQFRFYCAGGYQFTNNINLQLGYLSIMRETGNVSRFQVFFTHKLWFFDK